MYEDLADQVRCVHIQKYIGTMIQRTSMWPWDPSFGDCDTDINMLALLRLLEKVLNKKAQYSIP